MSESRLSKEMHRRIFELTLALYRVTDFFPPEEVLKRQLRERANEIFGILNEYGYGLGGAKEITVAVGKIKSILGFFKITVSQKYINPLNIKVLEREYGFISDFLERELSYLQDDEKEVKVSDKVRAYNPLKRLSPVVSKPDIKKEVKVEESIGHKAVSDIKYDREYNERQRAIIDHLKEKHVAKVSDFYDFFADISTKTVQRDLQDLVQKNILKKEGEKRWTQYTLIGVL